MNSLWDVDAILFASLLVVSTVVSALMLLRLWLFRAILFITRENDTVLFGSLWLLRLSRLVIDAREVDTIFLWGLVFLKFRLLWLSRLAIDFRDLNAVLLAGHNWLVDDLSPILVREVIAPELDDIVPDVAIEDLGKVELEGSAVFSLNHLHDVVLLFIAIP